MAYITKFDGNVEKTIQLGAPNNPTSVEGFYLGAKTTKDTGYGPGKLHMFQTPEGVVGVWGKTNSNRLLTTDLVGTMVLLNFTGMGPKQKGKNPAYTFQLQFDKDNTIDVSGIDLNASEEESSNEEETADEVNPTIDAATHYQRAATTPVPARAPAISAEQQARTAALLSGRNKPTVR